MRKKTGGRKGSVAQGLEEMPLLCNGDAMFHVNKGVIGFKMDAAEKVRLMNTSVSGIANFGMPGIGDEVCDYDADEKSHPAATLDGYGGAAVRAYTFAGSDGVVVSRASATGLSAMSGPAVAYAVLTDSNRVRFVNATADTVDAGWYDHMPVNGPNGPAYAAGYYISADSTGTTVARGCATNLTGYDGAYDYHDPGAVGFVVAKCRRNR